MQRFSQVHAAFELGLSVSLWCGVTRCHHSMPVPIGHNSESEGAFYLELEQYETNASVWGTGPNHSILVLQLDPGLTSSAYVYHSDSVTCMRSCREGGSVFLIKESSSLHTAHSSKRVSWFCTPTTHGVPSCVS